MQYLRGQCWVVSTLEAPFWISKQEEAEKMLVMNNGVLDVDRYLDNARCVRTQECGPGTWRGAFNMTHDPDMFTLNALPYDFSPGATCGKWLEFLERVAPDEAVRGILQEWCGYCLIPSQAYERILVLEGDGANGKSVFLNVLRRLVGVENCSSARLDGLHYNHALEPMVGKLLNICSEWGHLERLALNTLKSISGGDMSLINPKGRPAYEVALPTRFAVATNEAPSIPDKSGGTWRRLICVPFNVVIPEGERKPLEAFVEELCGELPGIFNWAMAGLERLVKRGQFKECGATLELKARYRTDSNSAMAWCEENLRVEADEEIAAGDVYREYNEWCGRSGYRPQHLSHFGRAVMAWHRATAGGPVVSERKAWTSEDGKKRRQKVYVGIWVEGRETAGELAML
jgi:putative DNA primase/helicase